MLGDDEEVSVLVDVVLVSALRGVIVVSVLVDVVVVSVLRGVIVVSVLVDVVVVSILLDVLDSVLVDDKVLSVDISASVAGGPTVTPANNIRYRNTCA